METKVNRRTSFADKLKIVEHLRASEAEIRAEGSTYTSLVKRVKNALDINISQDGIRYLCDEIGLTWERQKSGVSKGRLVKMEDIIAKMSRVLDDFKEKVADTERRHAAELALLRGAVNALYQQLGAKPPSGYSVPADSNRIRIVT